MFPFEKFLAIAGSLISLSASLYGVLTWQRNCMRQRIEHERQLAHALKNYAQLGEAIAQLQEQTEQQTLELAQIKTLLSIVAAPADSAMISNGKIRVRRAV